MKKEMDYKWISCVVVVVVVAAAVVVADVVIVVVVVVCAHLYLGQQISALETHPNESCFQVVPAGLKV